MQKYTHCMYQVTRLSDRSEMSGEVGRTCQSNPMLGHEELTFDQRGVSFV